VTSGQAAFGGILHRWHVHSDSKGVRWSQTTKRDKETVLILLADGAGTPLGVHVEQATPVEVRLLGRR
jgi:hypothetical protein